MHPLYSLYTPFIGVIVFLNFVVFFLLYLLYKGRIRFKQLNYLIVNATSNPTLWLNHNGDVLDISNKEHCLWLSDVDLSSRRVNVSEYISGECLSDWKRTLEEVLKTRKSQEVLLRCVAASGTKHFLRLHVVYYDKKTLVVFEQDLTDIEQERLEYKRQRYMMDSLLDNLPIPTTVKDINNDRRYLSWTQKTEELYSFTSEQLLGNNESVLTEELARVFRVTDEETLAKGASSTIQRVTLADGKKHTLSMHKVLVNYEEEQWIISSALDITELEEKRRELELLNKQYEFVLKAMEMISWVWDIEKDTITCYENSLIEGGNPFHVPSVHSYNSFLDLVVPEHRDSVRNVFNELSKGGSEVLNIECQVIDVQHEGHKIWVETFGIVSEYAEDGTAKFIIGAGYNIEERKRLDQALVTAKEQAEESNRLKSAFLANMSHEIRTPLNAIVGFSGILAERNEDEESKEYISLIENNNALLLQLINDILDLSKIEAGDMEFIYDNVDMHKCIAEIVAFAQLKVDYEIEIISDTPLEECVLYTERNRVIQVINNFVSNALKHTTSGSIHIGYNKPENGYIQFYVRDTGKGIPEKKKKQIFNRFIQLDTFKQGVGLGLAISKSIVEKMNGEIGLESTLGEGSEFWFTIPYQPVATEKKEAKNSILILEEMLDPNNPPSILVAEDSASNYKLYETLLGEDYALYHAWNGKEAVDFCDAVRPELILMDIKMPIMDGYEATEIIREKYGDIPIIAVTAHAFASKKAYTLNQYFDAFLSKPVNTQALKDAILEQLLRRQKK